MMEKAEKALKDAEFNLEEIENDYIKASELTTICSKKVFDVSKKENCDYSTATGKAHAIINSDKKSVIIDFENKLQANENTQELIDALVSWNNAYQNEIELSDMFEIAKREVIIAKELAEILQ